MIAQIFIGLVMLLVLGGVEMLKKKKKKVEVPIGNDVGETPVMDVKNKVEDKKEEQDKVETQLVTWEQINNDVLVAIYQQMQINNELLNRIIEQNKEE